MEELRQKLHNVVNLVSVELPFLNQLARIAQYCFDSRVKTAGVFRSGRIVINPRFFAVLGLDECVFVIAHELMHLQMQTHDRCDSTGILGNIAHDLIINDLLRKELGFIPDWVLRQDGASEFSVETIVVSLRHMSQPVPNRCFDWPNKPTKGPIFGNMAHALADAGVISYPKIEHKNSDDDDETTDYDLLSDQLEDDWYGNKQGGNSEEGDENRARQKGVYVQSKDSPPGAALVAFVAIGATAQEIIARSLYQDSNPLGNVWLCEEKTHAVARLEKSLDSSFEMTAQTWMDNHLPSQRSFARPSRRAGDRRDLVLPGRQTESVSANIVLDTSGSMWKFMPSVLSVIADSACAAGINDLRVIQCDMSITRDDRIQVSDLDEFVVSGFRRWEGQHVPETPKEPEPEPEKEKKPEPEKVDPPHRAEVPVKGSNHGYSYSAQRSSFPSFVFRRLRWRWKRVKNRLNVPKQKTHLFPVPNHPKAIPLEPKRSFHSAPDSNLTPAILELDSDPSVTSAIIITDGIVDIPAESPRIDVLWVVINNNSFEPKYGTVARLEIE